MDATYLCSSHGIRVNKIGKQTTVNEFDFHWVTYTSALVPNLALQGLASNVFHNYPTEKNQIYDANISLIELVIIVADLIRVLG